MLKNLSIGSLILLIIAFLIYSTTGVFSKLTSAEEFLSFDYFAFLSLVLLAMGIYAFLWQIILKKLSLSQAFLFKSMTVVFALAFAYFLFDEKITWNNIIGACIIIVGIIFNSLEISEV